MKVLVPIKRVIDYNVRPRVKLDGILSVEEKTFSRPIYAGNAIAAITWRSGISDSRIIVAINRDEDKRNFRVADIGPVADLFTAVPAIVGRL